MDESDKLHDGQQKHRTHSVQAVHFKKNKHDSQLKIGETTGNVFVNRVMSVRHILEDDMKKHPKPQRKIIR